MNVTVPVTTTPLPGKAAATGATQFPAGTASSAAAGDAPDTPFAALFLGMADPLPGAPVAEAPVLALPQDATEAGDKSTAEQGLDLLLAQADWSAAAGAAAVAPAVVMPVVAPVVTPVATPATDPALAQASAVPASEALPGAVTAAMPGVALSAAPAAVPGAAPAAAPATPDAARPTARPANALKAAGAERSGSSRAAGEDLPGAAQAIGPALSQELGRGETAPPEAAIAAAAGTNTEKPAEARPVRRDAAQLAALHVRQGETTQTREAVTPVAAFAGLQGTPPDNASSLRAAESALGVDALAGSAPTHATGVHVPNTLHSTQNLESVALRMEAPLGTPAWDTELGRHVVWLAGRDLNGAELHLNPADLGPVAVTLDMKGDEANAIFVAQHASTREALEQALPRLREMLAQDGISLGQADVRADTPQPRDSGERGAPQGQRQGAPGNGTAAPTAAQARTLHPQQGLVDTFA